MTPEDQQRVFDPFVQLDKHTGSAGTGLGLTITRQFVEMMDGTISLQSSVDEGSLFLIDLPLHEANKSDIVNAQRVDKGDVVGLAPGQAVCRILIVEDQRENQILLTRLMESVGFKVKLAENGKQGIELFQSWKPHFIWMDRRMPGMDGEEATRRIRELPEGKEVKIAAVTASAFREEQQVLLDAGMDDYVRKPYHFNELYDCLERQLGVKFIYSEDKQISQDADTTLTPSMLTGIKDQQRDELHRALDTLDSERIRASIDSIAEADAPLARRLHRLADNFDYPTIQQALVESTRISSE
jgi:CheY-like chemotaxis protein